MAPKVYGNPEATARKALEPYREEALRLLQEARRAAEKLVDEAAEGVLRDARSKFKAKAESLKEKIAGARAKAELEVKSRLAAEKNKYAEEAIRRAIEVFRSRKHASQSYMSFLRRALQDVLSEAGEKRVKIVAAPEDIDLVKSIASELGAAERIEVASDSRLWGGFIAEVEGTGLRIDFTLDNILGGEDARLRRAALRALFSE